MKKKTTLNLLASTATAALLTACAPTSELVRAPIATTDALINQGVFGSAAPEARTVSTGAFIAAPSLGICVADESTIAAPVNVAASDAAGRMLGLQGAPRLRDNFMLNCGTGNPVVMNYLAARGQTVEGFLRAHGRPDIAPPPTAAFDAVQVIGTGDYIDPTRQVECSGALTVGLPAPGARVRASASVLPEWGNMRVPPGYTVVSGNLACWQMRHERAKGVQVPVPN